MSTSLYETNKDGVVIYRVTGRELQIVPLGTQLECDDWAWDDGVLKGMQKIVAGDFNGRFVKSVDIVPVAAPEPEPEPVPTERYPDEHFRVVFKENDTHQETITEIIVPGKPK